MDSSPPPSTRPSTQQSKPKPIPNPRRLLILTPTSHSLPTIPPFLHSLTGIAVHQIPTSAETQAETFAGYTTHSPLHIENRYYTADVPVWVDEIPVPLLQPESKRAAGTGTNTGTDTGTDTGTPAQWKDEFSSAEARVVRDALGGVVVCIRNFESLGMGMSSDAGGESDPAERGDVKALKGFLSCIGEVKRLVQAEREGQDGDAGDGDDENGGMDVGLGDVLGVIVLVEDGSRKEKPSKSLGDDLDPDSVAGLETEKPFSVSWWEDQLDDIGLMDFEVVSWDPRAEEDDSRDKYGGLSSLPQSCIFCLVAQTNDAEFRGMRRIRQILETHDWSAVDNDPEDDINRILGKMSGLDDDLEEHLLGLDSSHGFNLEANELEREMLGLRMAIEHGGDEDQEDFGDFAEGQDDDGELQVESMEALMLRMQSIKDMSADLPESERRKFASKAVRDIMKEL